jgi:hypothetical protein
MTLRIASLDVEGSSSMPILAVLFWLPEDKPSVDSPSLEKAFNVYKLAELLFPGVLLSVIIA